MYKLLSILFTLLLLSFSQYSIADEAIGQEGIDTQFEIADTFTLKVQEIESALVSYYGQNNVWPSTLADIVTDGFYTGNFLTPYGGVVAGGINGNLYRLTFTAENETIANYLAGTLNGEATLAVVTKDIGTPSMAIVTDGLLSRVYDATGVANTMATNLLMDGNSIVNVGELSATGAISTTGNITGSIINATGELRDNGARVFSINNLPNKSHVGLNLVENYGVSNSYLGGATNLYASQKAVSDAYNALNTSKLDIGGKAADTDLFDGMDSTQFVQVSRTINGQALTKDIVLTAIDVGAVSRTGDEGLTGNYRTTGKLIAGQTIQAGYGSGGVALTQNDGFGNANVTFNHVAGVPEQTGNAARIIVNTDSTSGAQMGFNIKSGVTQGVATGLTRALTLTESSVNANVNLFERGVRVYSPNNDGSGSGLDADTVDGRNVSSGAAASTIALRTSAGDINARLFRSEYDITNANIGFIMTQIDTATNNYIRPSTPAQFRAAVTDPYYVPNSRTINGKALTENVTLSATDIGIGDRTNWNSSTSSYKSVVGQLAWRNYGNHHSIFDASAGLSPSDTAINRNTPNYGWIPSYPTLMGWNGTSTYGVRVDVASKLYYGTSKKAEATSTGIYVTGKVVSTTGWQSNYMNAFHSGNSFYMRPYDDGAWQSAREFGYDSANNRWFTETNFHVQKNLTVNGAVNVAGNVTANDVNAAGTSMSQLKAQVDALGGGGGGIIAINYQSPWPSKNISFNISLEVGGVYFVETIAVDGTSACNSSVRYFTLFKFTGVGQQEYVTGRCASYTEVDMMTINTARNITTETSHSYDIGILKVIRVQ